MFKRIQIGSTQSRKIFKVDRDKFIEDDYSPLLGESESEEERSNPSTPRGAMQLETQGTYGISHLPTPPPPSLPHNIPTPPPSLPPNSPTPPPPPKRPNPWRSHCIEQVETFTPATETQLNDPRRFNYRRHQHHPA